MEQVVYLNKLTPTRETYFKKQDNHIYLSNIQDKYAVFINNIPLVVLLEGIVKYNCIPVCKKRYHYDQIMINGKQILRIGDIIKEQQFLKSKPDIIQTREYSEQSLNNSQKTCIYKEYTFKTPQIDKTDILNFEKIDKNLSNIYTNLNVNNLNFTFRINLEVNKCYDLNKNCKIRITFVENGKRYIDEKIAVISRINTNRNIIYELPMNFMKKETFNTVEVEVNFF